MANLSLFVWHHVLLPGKSHGRRSLVGCSPWGHEESGTTEQLHFHISLSCIGEGNGNPLQYSCLENPRDRGAWWAAVYGVAQSRTRLKRLSSSSMDNIGEKYCSHLHCEPDIPLILYFLYPQWTPQVWNYYLWIKFWFVQQYGWTLETLKH